MAWILAEKEIERVNSANPNNVIFKQLPKDPGPGTGLRPENSKAKGPYGSVELEKLLYIFKQYFI